MAATGAEPPLQSGHERRYLKRGGLPNTPARLPEAIELMHGARSARSVVVPSRDGAEPLLREEGPLAEVEMCDSRIVAAKLDWLER